MFRLLDRPHQLKTIDIFRAKESILVRLAFIMHAVVAEPAAAWLGTLVPFSS